MALLDSRVAVIGGGGHAHVVIEIARAAGFDVAAVLDPDPGVRDILGVPNLGNDSVIPRLAERGIHGAVPAVGDNRVRRAVFQRIVDAGLEPVTAIHPSATISPSVAVGRGVVIMPNVVLNSLCRIGDNVIVNTAASIDHHGAIDDDVHVAPGCRLAGRVTVGRGSFLGIGVIVTPDVTIGADVFVPAGTTVTRAVPDGTRVRRIVQPG